MSIAFKEWAIICEMLGSGEQSLILRKGGIAEGRDGFAFKHPEFFLMPTRFHEQIAQTTLPAGTPIPETSSEGVHELKFLATISRTCVIGDLETALALAPLHHWSEATVRARFAYDEAPGISAALVRVYRIAPPHTFADAPKYGGCRSWVTIPDPTSALAKTPVLDEAAHAGQIRQFEQIAGQGNPVAASG